MATLKYDAKLVDNVLDYLSKAKIKLNGTEANLSGAINIVNNARGAKYVGSVGALSTITSKPSACISLIENAIKEINTRVTAIVQYNNNYDQAPLWKKLVGTIGMAAAKIDEGIIGAFEDIGDAALLIGAWAVKPIDAVFNTNAKEAIINFQKRDLSRELFDWIYYDRDIAQYSVFGPDSIAASVFRGLGQATGYIVMGGYVGGASNYMSRVATKGSNISKLSTIFQSTTNANALVAAVGGLGSGSEDAFDHGFDLGAATLFGIKDAAIQGGMAYAAGKIGEKQQVKAAKEIYEREMANAEVTARERIDSAIHGVKEWKGYLKYTDGAGNITNLDGAIKQVQAGALRHYNGAITEIGKLGGYTDRLTSKAYEKGFYDMKNLYTIYEQSGKGAAGLFKAVTVGQMSNLRNTGKDILSTPSKLKSDIAAYRDYSAALKEAQSAEAAGKEIPKTVQNRIDKYLNNNRGLDMFRVSNINPTSNIAKNGIVGMNPSHSYKLTHTRATVGEIVGSIAHGTATYAGMNALKDSIGELGQAGSQKLGMNKQLSRALFVDENKKYYDEDEKRPELVPETGPHSEPVLDSVLDTTPNPVPNTTPNPVPNTTPVPKTNPNLIEKSSQNSKSDSDPTPPSSNPQPRKINPNSTPVQPTKLSPKTNPLTQPKNGSITQPKTEPSPQPKIDSNQQPKANQETQPKTEPKIEAWTQPQTSQSYIPEYEAIPNTRIGENKTGDYSKVAVYGALTGAGVLGASLAAKKARDSNEEDEKDEKIGRYIETNTDNN